MMFSCSISSYADNSQTGGEMRQAPAAQFDVGRALEALDLVIETASQVAGPTGHLAANSSIVISAVYVLKDIQKWIERQRMPYQVLGGAPLIQAAATSSAIELLFFVATVRAAFLDLSRVSAFLSPGHVHSSNAGHGSGSFGGKP